MRSYEAADTPTEIPGTDRLGPEHLLAWSALALAGLGAVMSYSTTAPLALDATLPPHFLRHLGALAIGVVLALAAARLPLRAWHVLALPLWACAVAALVATLGAGVEVKGARRWLALPGLGAAFQPAELAKLAAVIAVAAVVARREGRAPLSGRRFAAAVGLGTLPAALLLGQPDLGSALLLAGLVGALLFAGGAPLRWLLAPASAVAVGVVGYVVLQPYAWRRWVGFLDPWETARNQGFQLVQSFVAFGRGGATGVGFGYGRQKLHYLPEAHTDFVLSVIAEELGLIGVLAVLLAFALVLVAGVRIALRARRRFAMLLAFGLTLLLVVPAALNAAVVMGLLPTKGLTLPFLSYGRSSLLVCCLAVGGLLSVAREPGHQVRPSRGGGGGGGAAGGSGRGRKR